MQDFMSDVEEVIRNDMNSSMPYTKIVEQPAAKALRFRYECEGRSAGSIPGASSTRENKVHPTIKVCNYKGSAIVVVSCVTKDKPYRPHPHNLVGKDFCNKGVCTVNINNEAMTCTFPNLGIQCVKRKEIEDALKVRSQIRVDPFRTGFDHKNQAGSIDLNCIRLCFQVFLEKEPGKYTYALQPVVSDPIFDKKAMSDLVIFKLSHCSAPVSGGSEIILLCDKISKDNIEVRFFELKDNMEVWHGFGDFHPADVHKQYAISFRTPRYKEQNIHKPVDVYIELRRKKDGATSVARNFQFTPLDRDPEGLNRKRMKIDSGVLSRYTVPRVAEGGIENRNIIHPNRSMKRESEFDPPNFIPTFITNPTPIVGASPSFPMSKIAVHATPLYESATSQLNVQSEFTDPPFSVIPTSSDPPPYHQLQPSPVSQSQFSPVSAISPISPNMIIPTPTNVSNIVTQFSSVITSQQMQSSNDDKTGGATLHNVPPIEPEQSIDEHMSEQLGSLDLGQGIETTEISLPLSDINLSLFESGNVSLNRILECDVVVDESNNNVVTNSAVKSDDQQSSDNFVSTDSIGRLTRHVNKELDTLNMLGSNVGLKSEMSSS